MSPTHTSRGLPGWLILMGALTAIGPFAIDMYLPAFPTIAANLGVPRGDVERTLAAYLIGLALAQVFYGPMADRYGRKPPLLVGLALFMLGSLGCALAGSAQAPDRLARAAGHGRGGRHRDPARRHSRPLRNPGSGARHVAADADHGTGADPGSAGRRAVADDRQLAQPVLGDGGRRRHADDRRDPDHEGIAGARARAAALADHPAQLPRPVRPSRLHGAQPGRRLWPGRHVRVHHRFAARVHRTLRRRSISACCSAPTRCR